MARWLILPALVAAAVLVPAPALADARVSVNPGTADPTYATTIKVSGSGFQSIKGGHGGIYVTFGTVNGGWRPSKGGVTGKDYFYVPDTEAKDNQGFQKYVAFPGSDTASSANGGVMASSGSWSTQLVVPGAVFKSYDRAGKVRTIDCRKVTCGVITVGAHGVTNGNNETFTPIRFAATSGPTSTTTSTTTSTSEEPTVDPEAPTASEAPAEGTQPEAGGPALIEVDRASAVAGNVLAFKASGLPAGAQVSAVFDDGAAGAGPFLVAADGTVAGVITLPATTGAGTHELRLFGVDNPPSVQFAVAASDADASDVAPSSSEDETELRVAWLFAGAAALVLVLALVRLALRMRRRPRAA